MVILQASFFWFSSDTLCKCFTHGQGARMGSLTSLWLHISNKLWYTISSDIFQSEPTLNFLSSLVPVGHLLDQTTWTSFPPTCINKAWPPMTLLRFPWISLGTTLGRIWPLYPGNTPKCFKYYCTYLSRVYDQDSAIGLILIYFNWCVLEVFWVMLIVKLKLQMLG